MANVIDLNEIGIKQGVQARRMTDAGLDFVKSDCLDAVAANPLGAKAVEYLLLAQACDAEQWRRAIKREAATVPAHIRGRL